MTNPANYIINVPAGTTKIFSGRVSPDQPASEIDIGEDWLFFGDSQTNGRAHEDTATSHAEAFVNILNQTNTTSTPLVADGVGGATIIPHNTRYSSTAGRDTATSANQHFERSVSVPVEQL